MLVKRTESKNLILHILEDFKESLFDKSFSDDFILREKAEKFSQKACFYYYIDNDVICGFCSFYINKECQKGFISMLIVGKEFQHKGIGTILINKCLEICKKRGLTKVELEVSVKNANAISFYERRGFIYNRVGREDAVIYSIDL